MFDIFELMDQYDEAHPIVAPSTDSNEETTDVVEAVVNEEPQSNPIVPNKDETIELLLKEIKSLKAFREEVTTTLMSQKGENQNDN